MDKLLTIGIPAESLAGEKRVALVPEDAAKLAASGFVLLVEKRAAAAAGFADQDYASVPGIKLVPATKAWSARLVLHIQPPTIKQITMMKKGSTLISHVFVNNHKAEIKAILRCGLNLLAMELIPRITRAQAIDSLSSQATVSGYWSVLHAAACCPVFFPMITYAAGTIRPARMLVIGVGVAGLQAIATARRLGAIVEAFDVRPETREQILSLGAKPVDLGFDASGEGGYARELTQEEQAQVADALTRSLIKANVVITTAGIPGRPSPKIVTKAQVEAMQPGSLIVDMVAENGGNCSLTKPGKVFNHKGILISGPINIPSNIPRHASEMFSHNIFGMVSLLIQNNQVVINEKDEIINACLLTHEGNSIHPTVQNLQQKPRNKKTSSTNSKARATGKKPSTTKTVPAKKTPAASKSRNPSKPSSTGKKPPV